MDSLQKEIIAYWQERATSYGKQHAEELHLVKKKRWQNFILPRLVQENKEQVKVLDVGTGPGFLAILLAEAGYKVSAVDFTPEMLTEAKKNAGDLVETIEWLEMDIQNLELPTETFDIVITRNVTWNLEDPISAYKEWYRVLKKGGTLINIDANWYRYLYDEKTYKKYLQDRQLTKEYQIKDYYEKTDIPAMERIAKKVPLSKEERPAWDEAVLLALGFKEVQLLEDINSLVFEEVEQINFAFSPLFLIEAKK